MIRLAFLLALTLCVAYAAVCRKPAPKPAVIDKPRQYPYLKDKYGRTIPFRRLADEFRDSWNDERNYPKITLTSRQRQWWDEIGKNASRSRNNANQSRSKRQVQIEPRCERKEYRTLSNMERTALHNAFNAMYSTIPDPQNAPTTSEYDVFVGMHRRAEAPAAHNGPAFLPWHREYLLRLEAALRKHEPSVCLPYWDSTLDETLPDPSDSAIWSSSYLGNNDGDVTSGFAAGWQTIPDCGNNKLRRDMFNGPSGQIALFSDSDINWVLGRGSFDEISCPSMPNCKFEVDHGSVHVFIGGHMRNAQCSPSDPVFWMHHAFVDCVWQRFRELSPYPNPPVETDYGTVILYHGPNDPMLPFDGLINAHGLSNHYTDYYYKCAPSPATCSATSKRCPSSLLWCDMTTCSCGTCQCKAKVRQGGNCRGLPDNACAGPCPYFRYPYVWEPKCKWRVICICQKRDVTQHQ